MPHVVNKIEECGLCYQTVFSKEKKKLGRSWPSAFSTQNKEEVEKILENSQEVEFYWGEGDRLTTISQGSVDGLRSHPHTHQKVWSNHLHLFHYAGEEGLQQLFKLYKADPSKMAKFCWYGDRSEIDPDNVKIIQSTLSSSEMFFTWKKGDVLVIDNLLMAHGQEKFLSERLILTAMFN